MKIPNIFIFLIPTIILFFSCNRVEYVNPDPLFDLQGFNICAWEKDWFHKR